jgi:hypothetical protein
MSIEILLQNQNRRNYSLVRSREVSGFNRTNGLLKGEGQIGPIECEKRFSALPSPNGRAEQ